MRHVLIILGLVACAQDIVALNGDPDPDGDGLNATEEALHGTTEGNPDTDGDNFLDGEEVLLGTDPLNRFDWPVHQDPTLHRWPDFSDSAPDPLVTGIEIGDAMQEFVAVDQYNDEVTLYQFYGHVVLLDFAAAWCGPCRTSAEKAMGLWEQYRARGLLIIHYMQDDEVEDPMIRPDLQADWADTYGLLFPVVVERGRGLFGDISASSLYEGGIPFFVVLDPELRLRGGFTGSGSESQIEALIDDLLPL